MRFIFIAVVAFFATVSVAQNTQTAPLSLRTAFSQPVPAPVIPSWLAEDDSAKTKGCQQCCGCLGGDMKYNLFLDSRQTFFQGDRARMNGIRVGAELYDKIRFGLGFYEMTQPIDITHRIADSGERTRTLDFGYNTAYVEYIAYRDFRWELSVPFQFGNGTGVVDSTNTISLQSGVERTDPVRIVTAGVAGYIRIIPWFGVGAGTGYVWAPSQNRTASKVFSAPYYSVRLKIFLGHLLKSMFAPTKLEEERKAYQKERAERRKRNSL